MGRRLLSAVLLASCLLLPGSLSAQDRRPPVDTARLSASPWARMEMLLEKSFLDIDVLSLRLRFGAETASRLRELAAGGGDPAAGSTADSLAGAALRSRSVWARVEYHRGFSYRRFVSGTRRNLSGLPRTPVADAATLRRISKRLPDWHGYLAGRGVRSGDVLHVRIRGDTVRTVYIGTDGATVADTTVTDELLRLSVLGRYFSPGSDFRNPLLESLPR